MAYPSLQLDSHYKSSLFTFQVAMEHYDDPKRLQGAITCSDDCAAIVQSSSTVTTLDTGTTQPKLPTISGLDSDSPALSSSTQGITELYGLNIDGEQDHVYTTNSIADLPSDSPPALDDQPLGDVASNLSELLEETKQAVYRTKQMKSSVINNRDNTMERTRKLFDTFRNKINEREQQVLQDIRQAADKKEKAIKLQLDKLLLLWTQLRSCLELVKKTRAEKLKDDQLTRRSKILQQRRDHLRIMKEQSKIDLTESEDGEVTYQEAEKLFVEMASKIEGFPVDPSKCTITFPKLAVNKEAIVTVFLKNLYNGVVNDGTSQINVSLTDQSGQVVLLEVVKAVGNGSYETAFVPKTHGNYELSVLIGEEHIPGSPFKLSILLRDYSNMSEKHCSTLVTHYGQKKLGGLRDVAVGPFGEIAIVDGGNNCVVVLDSTFAFVNTIGQYGCSTKLVVPSSVAVSTDGVVAVSDWGSGQVKKYSLQGNFLSAVGIRGSKDGQFNCPMGLAFSSDNVLFIVDSDNYRVQVFQQDGTFMFCFGGEGDAPGQFQYPVRVAVSVDNVAVSDLHGNCIQLFSHTGSFISKIECLRPWGIILTPDGYIIANSDGDDDKIKVWNYDHQRIVQFGNKGSKLGEFYSILGISLDHNGVMYVAEGVNERLQVICNM